MDREANHGWLANSFSLGMIALSLMTMKHMNEMYDYRTCEIDYSKVDQTIKAASSTFSPRTIKIA